MKKDSMWLGMGIGLIVPLIFFLGVMLLIRYVKVNEHTQSFLYILGVGFNALIMRFYSKRNKENTAKGILFISFIYAFIFFFYKLKISQP